MPRGRSALNSRRQRIAYRAVEMERLRLASYRTFACAPASEDDVREVLRSSAQAGAMAVARSRGVDRS